MKILLKQFLGQLHSWSNVGWSLAQAAKQAGHEVHLFATDGIKYLPDNLKENLIGYTDLNQQKIHGRLPDAKYDCQISYTCIKNFQQYLSYGKKNRFGIWCYEWCGKNVLPTGFAKHYQYCDFICPPSRFAKQVFIDSGITEDRIKVISHGVDIAEYKKTTTIKLPTKKRFKLLANLAQTHKRKNIPGLLDAYGKAFTNKDDVCLIIKAKNKPITSPFEVSLSDCLHTFHKMYPQAAEIKLFSDFLDDMSILYRSVDAVYTLTNAEAYYMPGLEALLSSKLNIAPRWGGQLDFLDNSNALLIDGKEGPADPKSMYWESKAATCFYPSIDDAVEKLRYAYTNYETMNAAIDKQRPQLYLEYDWDNIFRQFMDLCK